MFYEKGVLKTFGKFKGKQLCQSLFSIKLQTWGLVFSCPFCETFNSIFFYGTTPGDCFWKSNGKHCLTLSSIQLISWSINTIRCEFRNCMTIPIMRTVWTNFQLIKFGRWVQCPICSSFIFPSICFTFIVVRYCRVVTTVFASIIVEMVFKLTYYDWITTYNREKC